MGKVEMRLIEKADQGTLKEIAKSIRSLSIDAIDAANSGHPGLPLGCADIVAYLYANVMRFDPKQPDWMGRDRFVLSAGHGSMVLYAILYLAGYDVSENDIRNFRQMGSNTPGHPEFGMTPGVETTTGPLGQGLATGVGMALAGKRMAEQFEIGESEPHYYVLAGDGDLMEGVSAEASSLAGHLQLNNITVVYDANDICLDGPTTECFTENVQQRYKAYGWNVMAIDGHSFSEIESAFGAVEKTSNKPRLIIAKTTIGLGSPNREGTSEAHGKPLGSEEAKLTKEVLGIPVDQPFWVSSVATNFFDKKSKTQQLQSAMWQTQFEGNLEKSGNEFEWIASINKLLPDQLEQVLDRVEMKPNAATRVASNTVMQALKSELSYLVVGSADLSCSDNTILKNEGVVEAGAYSGRNIKFGVREFAMAAMANGMALGNLILPVVGTFLTFSDYMRNAIRLSALMNQKVIYHFTHDSIFLGEDGPTHQPVEQLASLRAIPNLTVIRPADANEVKGAWLKAVSAIGPVALIMSRLNAMDLETTDMNAVQKGAYCVHKETGDTLDKVILATGTEVALAIDVATMLAEKGESVRVISMPSMELFREQTKAYQDEILGTNVGQYVVIEAGTRFGWHEFVGRSALFITVETFGESAPSAELAKHFGFTKEAVLERLSSVS